MSLWREVMFDELVLMLPAFVDMSEALLAMLAVLVEILLAFVAT